MSGWQVIALYITGATLVTWLAPLLFGIGEGDDDIPPVGIGLLWPMFAAVLAVALPLLVLDWLGKLALRLHHLTASETKETRP